MYKSTMSDPRMNSLMKENWGGIFDQLRDLQHGCMSRDSVSVNRVTPSVFTTLRFSWSSFGGDQMSEASTASVDDGIGPASSIENPHDPPYVDTAETKKGIISPQICELRKRPERAVIVRIANDGTVGSTSVATKYHVDEQPLPLYPSGDTVKGVDEARAEDIPTPEEFVNQTATTPSMRHTSDTANHDTSSEMVEEMVEIDWELEEQKIEAANSKRRYETQKRNLPTRQEAAQQSNPVALVPYGRTLAPWFDTSEPLDDAMHRLEIPSHRHVRPVSGRRRGAMVRHRAEQGTAMNRLVEW
jgi:hypothetical protein